MELIRSTFSFLSSWVVPLVFLFIFGAFFYSIFITGRKGTSTLWGRSPRRKA